MLFSSKSLIKWWVIEGWVSEVKKTLFKTWNKGFGSFRKNLISNIFSGEGIDSEFELISSDFLFLSFKISYKPKKKNQNHFKSSLFEKWKEKLEFRNSSYHFWI